MVITLKRKVGVKANNYVGQGMIGQVGLKLQLNNLRTQLGY